MTASAAASKPLTQSTVLAELLERVTAQVRTGGAPDIEALVQEYPEHADELHRLLPAVQLLAELSTSSPDNPASGSAGVTTTEPLGDFRLLREIGRGGMGIVYEAEQLSLNRRVALKVLPFAATMDPRQLQRFKNEALAAASLEHPSIVPVYGVGCERAVHFYAMKFIEGQTLAQLIQSLRGPDEAESTNDETAAYPAPIGSTPTAPIAGLSTKHEVRGKAHYRRIAELIAEAADALEHAHSMGIVHRDVKPGNLLLDAVGKIYISDFGLARFGTEAGMTMSGDLIGTLRYMSPEQALARHGLVDYRTDIYSLGATLYELLTLKPAVPGDDKAEILKSIAWEEPAPLRKLDKSIPAELETIALKCLAKNPGERYASAGDVAEDLRRWLGDQTIKAKPPGWRERTGKWARRHQYLVRSAAVVLAVAVTGLAISNVLINREKNQKDAALATAQQRLALIEKGNAILASILRDVNPTTEEREGKPLRALLAERLERAAEQMEEEISGDPLDAAKLQATLGEAFLGLGLPEKGIAVFAKVRATYSELLGLDHPDMLEVMNNLGLAYEMAGRSGESLALLEETVKRSKIVRGPGHPDTLINMNNLATTLQSLGRFNDALVLMEEALRLSKARNGPEHPATLTMMNNVASSYRTAGRLPEAVLLMEESLQIHSAKSGPEHIDTLSMASNLAQFYKEAGRLTEALSLCKDTLNLQKTKLGLDNPHTLNSMHNLAGMYHAAWRIDEAVSLADETLKLSGKRLGPEHPFTLTVMTELANTFHSAGRRSEALALHEKALHLRTVKLGPDHPDTITSMNDFANALMADGRSEEALALLEAALTQCQSKLGPDHYRTLVTMNNVAGAYSAADRLSDAIQLYEKTLALLKAMKQPDHPLTFDVMNSLANTYLRAGRTDNGEELAGESLRLRKLYLGPDHPDTAQSLHDIACRYRDSGRFEQAVPLFREAIKIRRDKLGPEHPSTLASMNHLGNGYLTAGKLKEGIGLNEEVLRLRRSKLGPDHPDTAESLFSLGSGYRHIGKYDQAISFFEEAVRIRKKKLGPENPRTLDTVGHLALTYEFADKYDLALPLFEEVVKPEDNLDEIMKRANSLHGQRLADFITDIIGLGKCHRQLGRPGRAAPLLEAAVKLLEQNKRSNIGMLGIAKAELARTYQADGKLSQAISRFGEALECAEAYVGPENPGTVRAMGELAAAYAADRRYADAVRYHKKALEILRRKVPADHPQLAANLATLGLTLLHAGQPVDAEPILREALAIREKKEPDVWTTFNTRSLLGSALLGQKKYADAEPLLLQGYEGMRQREAKILPPATVRLTEALERMVRLYEATDKKGQAAKWRKKLEAARSAEKKPQP